MVSPVIDGEYTVRVLYDEGESDESNVVMIKETSVSGLDVKNKDVIYYDLDGFRVNNPESGKIYIRWCGGKVTKELYK